MLQLFDFNNYRKYLNLELKERGKEVRGIRTRLAEALNCRSGYVTQILDGSAELSLEQAVLASHFLNHTNEEADYFLLLVQESRAGNPALISVIARQKEELLKKRTSLQARFKAAALPERDQGIFYSGWEYVAILTLLSLPHLTTREQLAEHLDLPISRVAAVLEYLEKIDLIRLENGRYQSGMTRTHLGKSSPFLVRHHLNWRMQAMRSIETRREADLHYSAVIAISHADRKRIQHRIIEFLEEINGVIGPSQEEVACSLGVDFFDI